MSYFQPTSSNRLVFLTGVAPMRHLLLDFGLFAHRLVGNQPSHGTMSCHVEQVPLSGYDNCGTIVIDYHFSGGIQSAKHPSPGYGYGGTHRTAYLPDNKEGHEVLVLLKRAFNQLLLFKIGTSVTTGATNVVVWNDVHHKTSRHGGP